MGRGAGGSGRGGGGGWEERVRAKYTSSVAMVDGEFQIGMRSGRDAEALTPDAARAAYANAIARATRGMTDRRDIASAASDAVIRTAVRLARQSGAAYARGRRTLSRELIFRYGRNALGND